MKLHNKLAASTIVLFGLFSVNACAQQSSGELTNQEKAIALLESIETGDKSPIAYVNPNKYIQHNLSVADGLAGFGEVLQALPEGSAKVNVVRSFQDGDYVVTHTDYNFFGPKVGFDIFRFENGQIVEHWDNLTEKLQGTNPSGRTQLDGATEITDLDKTEENKALVASFVDQVLVKGHYDQLTTFISSETYLQHNTSIGDGLSGLGKAIEEMTKQGISMVYETNHKVLGQGNFVLAISEGSFAGKTVSFYDLFRIENGKIVEHWDVIEPMLPEAQWKNTNGKFGFEHDYIVEVATFALKGGVTANSFKPLDQQVEQTHVSKQPGFISRESGLTEDNYWRVIVHWQSFEDADASMASFMEAPAAKAFLESADTSTMIMRRYAK
jgi:predicted SnoaL-like aldol condensation-catalyzing enzyme